ncbi:sensor histidine kinase [Carbonactinospora thermoautotrophica]|uniref:Signal transduction histidine-protein kinase/phosphatase MprB n=1 Tax=Carbonactinospora thermoautotrophica TaxID=1469144 RepID=A0A132N9Q7_9ACTN|nr:ATP-binding protein [Carbonactinospora thermoautotrophica]KWX02415.1 putative two-component system sensor kinase [Carbonactinospora thermoautotrophica]KWX03549.1 histidine kinase [Carbonactinospora thermoautotrophica]KWX06858.1 histidine kinase [Carbonactinospora thermoautotrophica]MCX9190294.1 sensor histidine kinase [Carbonactinospora thermoautotrophica]
MRSRLLSSTLTVVLVVVVLLGVPLGVIQARSIESRARDHLQVESQQLASNVELWLENRVPVEPQRLARQLRPDQYAVVRIPGRPPIAVGTPPREDDVLAARGVGAHGETVELVQGREDIEREIQAFWLLILAASLFATASAAGLTLLQARRITGPLADLVRAAERLGSGDPKPRRRHYGIPELDRVAEVLDSSGERIARMITAERRLAADASHQLRTPLTALSMRLEEIIATDDPQIVKEEAAIALSQVERLTDVVQRLLNESRERQADSAVQVDVDDVVHQQIEEWRPAFRKADRRLKVRGEPGLRAVATPGALAQVLACLLENALMHGKGSVTVRTRRLSDWVVVEVADEGPGVPPELGNRIFERAVSGRNSTGLGLAVARDLAEADGGRLELLQLRPPVFAIFLNAYEARLDTSGGAHGS